MLRVAKILVFACLVALASIFTASAASFSPATSAVSPMHDLTKGVIKVHGCHRQCARGPRGWHRHVGPNCVRRICRPWKGQGRRPDYCVKIGKIMYCEY